MNGISPEKVEKIESSSLFIYTWEPVKSPIRQRDSYFKETSEYL